MAVLVRKRPYEHDAVRLFRVCLVDLKIARVVLQTRVFVMFAGLSS